MPPEFMPAIGTYRGVPICWSLRIQVYTAKIII